jgi:hypothetical protein
MCNAPPAFQCTHSSCQLQQRLSLLRSLQLLLLLQAQALLQQQRQLAEVHLSVAAQWQPFNVPQQQQVLLQPQKFKQHMHLRHPRYAAAGTIC